MFYEDHSKSTWPASKSYENVRTAAEDLLISAKLNFFFSFPAWSHQSFLVMYQTDKPVVLYIYQDIQKIDEVACKAWYVNKCDSISKLKNVPLNNKKFYEN